MDFKKIFQKKKLPNRFRQRYLSSENAKSKLKLKWIEEVDAKNKQSIINLMEKYPLKMVTLSDAFRIAKSIKDVDDMDLNKKVKQVVKQKFKEFEEWENL